MAHDEVKGKKQGAAKFEGYMKKFGNSLGEILENPELRRQEKECGMAVLKKGILPHADRVFHLHLKLSPSSK